MDKEMVVIDKNPVIIKNKNFRTIIIEACFPLETKLDDCAKRIILASLLTKVSNKYKTEDEFEKEKMRRHIVSLGYSIKTVNARFFMSFYLVIPDPIYIKEDILENAINFLRDVIYDPYVLDRNFSKDIYEKEVSRLRQNVENAKNRISRYGNDRTFQLVDNIGYKKNNIVNNDYLIEELSPDILYKYYEDTILQINPLIFVMGNIEERAVIISLKKYFVLDANLLFEKNYNAFLSKKGKKINYINEKGAYNQSSVFLAYKVKNMEEKDKIKLIVVKNILFNRVTDLLYRNLRTKLNLVYEQSVSCYSNSGLLIINALIKRSSKEQTIKEVKNTINQLKNESVVAPLLKNIEKYFKTKIKISCDNKFEVFDNYMSDILKIDYSDIEIYNEIKKMETSDICDFAKKLELDTVYFLEGEYDGK